MNNHLYDIMFTGIIQYVFFSKVLHNHLYLYGDQDFLSRIKIGDSVAVDGVCLTVVEIFDSYCAFQLSKETLAITILKK